MKQPWLKRAWIWIAAAAAAVVAAVLFVATAGRRRRQPAPPLPEVNIPDIVAVDVNVSDDYVEARVEAVDDTVADINSRYE